MDKTKIMQQLMATFLEELEEHLRAFNQDLLALEKNPSSEEQAERFKTLFRSAHSLKGAARSVNVPLIERACHCLEDILARLRDRHMELTAEVFGLLFAAFDAVEEAGMRLREQQDLADAPLAALLPRLEAGALGTFTPLTAPPVPTRSAAPEYEPEPSLGSGSVRVPAEKLDVLLARVGELLLAKGFINDGVGRLTALAKDMDSMRTEWKQAYRLAQRDGPSAASARTGSRLAADVLERRGDKMCGLLKDFGEIIHKLAGNARLLDHVTRPIDAEVRRVRMLPFSEACAGLDRMARDLAHAKGKEVDLTIAGGAVELDRSILEGLKDPLRQLVRNAIDHGIETPAQRRDASKSPRARIRIAAALRGSQVEVRVEDDGRGLDLEAIRAQARRRGIDAPADEPEAARLIFLPGFSTAASITDVSGRGVGLDIVKNRIEALHGTVDLWFESGRGTRFTLNAPLTLTTLRAVVVAAGGQTYAFASTNVHKMMHVHAADFRTVAGRETLMLEGVPLAVAALTGVLNPNAAFELSAGNIPVIVLASGTAHMAFVVDELLSEQEVLIKNLGVRIRRAPLVAGATLLPSGRIALVLNAANLVRRVLQPGTIWSQVRAEKQTTQAARKRLLVVEDSVTTRTLMKSILEAAGFDVATAVDGQAAWQFLQERDVHLVVSDVDMPLMDGFELTGMLRRSKKLKDLPVILVTARETEADKKRGLDIGANDYVKKSGFDQRELLESIRQLI